MNSRFPDRQIGGEALAIFTDGAGIRMRGEPGRAFTRVRDSNICAGIFEVETERVGTPESDAGAILGSSISSTEGSIMESFDSMRTSTLASP